MSARPAPPLRSVAALATLELRLAARRGENLLVTLVIPVAVLLFVGGTGVLAGPEGRAALVPGTMALGIVAAGLVNLGIATAFERHYGVLKRLGGAPLPRWGLLLAKLAAVLALEAVQIAALAIVANVAFGWTPGPAWSPVLLLLAVAVGTLAFVALGLLLAGALRAEAVLALANGLFLAFLMLGGIILPIGELPGWLGPIAGILPATALADLLRVALDSGAPEAAMAAPPLVLLAAWAAGSSVLAAATFRWDS